MVMEDQLTRSLVGLSCIFSKTGGYEPFYSYRRVVELQTCEHLGIQQEVEVLVLDKLHDGPTEIGSLFLRPDYRGKGRGRLLSLARFLFMAMNPRRFSDRVIAEMRGVSNSNTAALALAHAGRRVSHVRCAYALSQLRIRRPKQNPPRNSWRVRCLVV